MTDKINIALGVTGGIAAYKSADLCSKLVQRNFNVDVVMTANALRFVGAITFQTLSKNAVITSLWDNDEVRPEHVALADKIDLLLIAPATANIIAKIRYGLADDALSTLAVSATCPVLIAPAMNPKMWANPVVQDNVYALQERGIGFVGPNAGHVACGADGPGRMAEVNEILATVCAVFDCRDK